MRYRGGSSWRALLIVLAGAFPVSPSSAQIAGDVEAVEPPSVILKGRVLRKDGVIPVERAQLVLTNRLDGSVHTIVSGRRGRYKISLPVGQYSLAISEKRMERYESPSVYRVLGAKRIAIDFLLLRDYDKTEKSGDLHAGARLPEPLPEEMTVVGTVVDMIHVPEQRGRMGWRETLGFIGSVLAVALAAD